MKNQIISIQDGRQFGITEIAIKGELTNKILNTFKIKRVRASYANNIAENLYEVSNLTYIKKGNCLAIKYVHPFTNTTSYKQPDKLYTSLSIEECENILKSI